MQNLTLKDAEQYPLITCTSERSAIQLILLKNKKKIKKIPEIAQTQKTQL